MNELKELDEFTDDELEHMLEEVNGQGKDTTTLSDSAPTSIAGRSYDSSSDVTEESYNVQMQHKNPMIPVLTWQMNMTLYLKKCHIT